MWILCLFDTGPPMASVLFAMFELPLEMLAKSMSFGWNFEKFLEVSNSKLEKRLCAIPDAISGEESGVGFWVWEPCAV